MQPAVYILANAKRGTLYTGVTADLRARLWTHTNHLNPDSFSSRYNVTRLVYYEPHATMLAAIQREKQIKAGSRARKLWLIECFNPEWRDLSADVNAS